MNPFRSISAKPAASLQHKVDFEAIDDTLWDHICRLFGVSDRGVRHGLCLINPTTRAPRVTANITTLQIRSTSSDFPMDADLDWTVGDLKVNLCASLKLDPTTCTLRHNNRIVTDGHKLSVLVKHGKIFDIQEPRSTAPALSQRKPSIQSPQIIKPQISKTSITAHESRALPKEELPNTEPLARPPLQDTSENSPPEQKTKLQLPGKAETTTKTAEPFSSAPTYEGKKSDAADGPFWSTAASSNRRRMSDVLDATSPRNDATASAPDYQARKFNFSPFSPHMESRHVNGFPRPVGLINLGNTCFFNSAVQCLARVPALCSCMFSSDFGRQINTRNPKGSRGEIARAWKCFLVDMCDGGLGARDPSALRRAIASKFRRFANYGQHDSQELLCSLLDGLHEDLNQSSAAKGDLAPIPVAKDADSWAMHLARNSSPIVEIFHGQLYSSVECPACRNIETVHDPFMFLSLEIPNRYSTVTLRDCLASFSSSDTLDEANKWKCGKCQKKVRATKRMGVGHCPRVLIIHFKRFSAMRYSKIDTSVDYPDVLDSADFAAKPTGKYKLIGAVFHSGGLGGGHYTAAALDQPSERWFNFNDSLASPIDRARAHQGSAYLLVYERL
jgi:ubiquitin C-terminal hydrolase